MTESTRASQALRDGGLALLPTDTVYGLVCVARSRAAALDLYRLKGREAIQPTAVIAAERRCPARALPGLDGIAAAAARALLPGPFTLVVPNPERRFGWLSASRPETMGVRVPVLPPDTAAVLEQVRAVVATSANLPGGADPRRLSQVPEQILHGVAATIDGGELPGIPSTVVDVTGPEPVVLRLGAGDPAPVLRTIAATEG